MFVFCAFRNACDAEASFLNLLFIACVFYSFVVYGGEQGHVSELHNVFFVVEHFD